MGGRGLGWRVWAKGPVGWEGVGERAGWVGGRGLRAGWVSGNAGWVGGRGIRAGGWVGVV